MVCTKWCHTWRAGCGKQTPSGTPLDRHQTATCCLTANLDSASAVVLEEVPDEAGGWVPRQPEFRGQGHHHVDVRPRFQDPPPLLQPGLQHSPQRAERRNLAAEGVQPTFRGPLDTPGLAKSRAACPRNLRCTSAGGPTAHPDDNDVNVRTTLRKGLSILVPRGRASS